MKKNQKRSNLGKLVLTCKNYQDLRRQLQDDTELLGKMISGLIDQHCNWHSPYDQEVLTNVLTTILACVTELAERDGVRNFTEVRIRKRHKINPSTSSGTVVGEPVEPKK